MNPPPTAILVCGAAGSGTSTLGRALASQRGVRQLDLDSVLWAPSDPPYSSMNPLATREGLLRAALHGANGWVISGSPGAWCDFLLPMLRLAIFLRAPTAVRIQRIQAREALRFGTRIEEGGPLHAQHAAFLRWAALYDEVPPEGRSLARHEAWLATCTAPVLRLTSTASVDALVRVTMAHPAMQREAGG